MPKVIWILWLQGWEKAPGIISRCLDSWCSMNPNYLVHSLSLKNIFNYIPAKELSPFIINRSEKFLKLEDLKIEPEAFSDIVRIKLLQRFGGIWVDASTFCSQKLDDWLPELMTSGFFAYEKPAVNRPLSSWFIAANLGNYLIQEWHSAVVAYWNNRSFRDDYFWFHHLFEACINQNRLFAKEWSNVPKIGAVHPFHFGPNDTRLLKDIDPTYSTLLSKPPVGVFKLTHKIAEDFGEESLLNQILNSNANKINAKEVKKTKPAAKKILVFWYGSMAGHGTIGDQMAVEVGIQFLLARGHRVEYLSWVPLDVGNGAKNLNNFQNIGPTDQYDFVLFVCGPIIKGHQALERFFDQLGLLDEVKRPTFVGVGVSLFAERHPNFWNPFDRVLARQGGKIDYGDLAILHHNAVHSIGHATNKNLVQSPSKTKIKVGLVLRGYQEEYGPENCKSQEVADLLTALKARKHLEYLVIDHKLSEVETSEHIFRAYEKCDLIITTRFHGVILSLKSKKPFLAIDQIIDSKGKLRKLIETLKWPYVFYGESITIEDVEKAIDELLLEKDIESQLEQVSINEGKRSSLTLEELEEIIDSDDNAIKEVIVAGMHRSGTSMVGNLLKNMGFNMGLEKDLMPGNHYNLFGYFEHLEAVEINNDILNHYGASWIDVGPFVKNYHANDIDKVLKFADEKGGVRLTIGERINHLLRKLRKGGKDFAIKDPRFCLTLSFWLPFLHSPRLLICIRHPSEVALSIFKRDRYPQNVVNEVWVTYYAFLSKAMSRSEIESPYLLINFSDLRNEGEKIIGVLGAFLGIAFKKEKLANTIKQDLISVSLDSINTAKDSNFFALKLFEQMVSEGKIPKIPLVEKFSNIHPTIYLKVGEKVYRARRQGSRYEVMVAFNSKLSFISFPLVIRDIRMDHSRLEIWPSCYVSGDKYLFKWHNDELNISTNDQSIKENDRVTLSFDLIGIYEELLHGIDYTAFSREFMFSQLFWKKEEEEFNEHRSKKWVVSNQRVVINIGQFIQDEGTSIRVDPVNDFVILQVENRKDIPEVILKEIGRFASSFELEEGIFYFLTDDPWFIIDAAELAIVEELILNIKFLRLGKVAVMESYHHHLNQLNKHLDELNRRLDLYENRLQERDQQLQERDQQLQERDQQLQERDQQLAIQLSEVQILKEHNKNLLEEKKALKNSISFRFGQLIVKPLSIFLKKS